MRDQPVSPAAVALGARIRTLREARGKRLEDLATDLGLKDAGVLSRIERGLQDVPFTRLCDLAVALRVTVQNLIPSRRRRFASTQHI